MRPKKRKMHELLYTEISKSVYSSSCNYPLLGLFLAHLCSLPTVLIIHPMLDRMGCHENKYRKKRENETKERCLNELP